MSYAYRIYFLISVAAEPQHMRKRKIHLKVEGSRHSLPASSPLASQEFRGRVEIAINHMAAQDIRRSLVLLTPMQVTGPVIQSQSDNQDGSHEFSWASLLKVVLAS